MMVAYMSIFLLQCSCAMNFFPNILSTLLHLRRKGHPLPATYRPRTSKSSLPSLGVPRPSATGSLPPLAPRPSALHIQAAIALSELGEKRLGDIDRCDIGVQTQPVESSVSRTKEGSRGAPARLEEHPQHCPTARSRRRRRRPRSRGSVRQCPHRLAYTFATPQLFHA